MDIVEEAVEAIEEVFPPRPGGLVHRHREREAARQAEIQEQVNENEPIEERSYKAVKVAPESPEVISPMTYTIQSGASAMILPHTPYRYRATILVVTAASTVLLAKDNGAAIGGVGFVLATGVPLPVFSRAQMWALNNTGATVQVSVLSEIYAPEK